MSGTEKSAPGLREWIGVDIGSKLPLGQAIEWARDAVYGE